MAHSYPLYTDVMAQCFCCQSLQPFHFTSATDQVVCGFCRKHLGSDKAERRDADHVALWVALFAAERAARQNAAATAKGAADERDREIAKLSTSVGELTASIADEFTSTPDGAVRDILQTEIVRRAERNTVLADRHIDRLMGAIWRINVLHHDDDKRAGRCSCGRPTAECPEGLVIDAERPSLASWENRNVALLREGKRHGLPGEHPEVAKVAASARRRPAARGR
jgi:hypothetical protein